MPAKAALIAIKKSVAVRWVSPAARDAGGFLLRVPHTSSLGVVCLVFGIAVPLLRGCYTEKLGIPSVHGKRCVRAPRRKIWDVIG